MASVSTAFTAVAEGDPIQIQRGEQLTSTLTGTFVATLNLERSESGGASWDIIETVTAGSGPTTITYEGTKRYARYRWNCTAFTSGTATGVVKDTTEEVLGNGTVPVATVLAFEHGVGPAKQTYLECNALIVTITDDAGVAQFGGVKVYDFPEGMLLMKGAQLNGILTAGVTGTIIDDWDGDVALGTATATTGATLTGTEADYMPSVAVSAGGSDKDGVVNAASVATALTESGARWHDGTATAMDLFLNFVIDDDASHTAGTASFTGTIVINWEMLGDN